MQQMILVIVTVQPMPKAVYGRFRVMKRIYDRRPLRPPHTSILQ